jgi:hypothetical protein
MCGRHKHLVVELLSLLLRIRNVLISSLGPEFDNSDRYFTVFVTTSSRVSRS